VICLESRVISTRWSRRGTAESGSKLWNLGCGAFNLYLTKGRVCCDKTGVMRSSGIGVQAEGLVSLEVLNQCSDTIIFGSYIILLVTDVYVKMLRYIPLTD